MRVREVLRWMSSSLTIATVVWCAMVGGWLWTREFRVSAVEITAGSGQLPTVRRTEYYQTFSDMSHFGVAPLVVPLIFAALATWAALARRPGWVLAVGLVLLMLSLLGAMSIGLYYLPAAGALVVAAGFGFADKGGSRTPAA